MKCRHISGMTLAIVRGELSDSMVIGSRIEQKLVPTSRLL